jgi:hypothetical protein
VPRPARDRVRAKGQAVAIGQNGLHDSLRP